SGKRSIIGNGCVVDPFVLVTEVEALRAKGIEPQLHLSDRAHLILPYHSLLDAAEEATKGNAKVGTTGRGIGPGYADKVARSGMQAGDLVKPVRLKAKLDRAVAAKNAQLKLLGSPS